MPEYKEEHIIDGLSKYTVDGRRQWLFYVSITSFIFWLGFFLGHSYDPVPQELISPLPEQYLVPAPTETPTPTPTVAPKRSLKGTASYYSRAGCLGCSENLTMANGETFTDEGLTIALTPETVRAHKLLNDEVEVINNKNGKSIRAKVTDTGGFNRYKRIADLSLATKNSIDCSDLCDVTIKFDNNVE